MSGIAIIGNYRITQEKPLGKGSFGTVYKVCKVGETGVTYALKRISLKGLSPKDISHCKDEINWMKELQHRNIIQLHDSFDTDKELNIVMEFCQGGSLREYIKNTSLIPETICLEMMDQICTGLKFLHDKKLMHRDIKTGNIFLQGKVVKLGDLALVRLLENPDFVGKITKKVGTLSYMSPEMIAEKPYGFETDVWSLGCCLYEMAMKKIPYPAKTEIECERKIRTEQVSLEGFPYDSKIRKLIEEMLEKDPSNRPKIETVSQQIQTYMANGGKVNQFAENAVSLYERRKELNENVPEPDCQRLMSTFPGNKPKSTDASGTEPVLTPRERRRKTKAKIVQVPVRISEDEYNRMCQADQLQQVLETKYLSDKELQEMFEVLEANVKENMFLHKMKIIVGEETYRSAEPFLKSYWLFKAPLLRKRFTIVCKRIDR